MCELMSAARSARQLADIYGFEQMIMCSSTVGIDQLLHMHLLSRRLCHVLWSTAGKRCP